MNRRKVLSGSLTLLAASLLPSIPRTVLAFDKLAKSNAEWRALLPAPAYRVLFEEATEPARSSPLDEEKRAGTFVCAACYLPLFDSEKKYESGTGWPSFFDVRADAIGTRTDYRLILPRTEYHCAHCRLWHQRSRPGHHGHGPGACFSQGLATRRLERRRRGPVRVE